MKRKHTLSLAERAFVSAMDVANYVYVGTSARDFVEEMVKSFGPRGYLAWMKMGATVIPVLSKAFGPTIGQHLIGIGAMWNGCTYCGRGHTMAGNLIHFKETGELFPLDEHDIIPLQRMTDAEIVERLKTILAAPEHARALQLFLRQLELKNGTAGSPTPDDEALKLSIAAWDWTTECTIMLEHEEVPVAAPISKDKENTRRYLEARAKERARRGDPTVRGATTS